MTTTITRALAVAAIALGVAACGGSTRAHPTPTPPASGPAAYAQCMRAHGIRSFPNPVDGHITLTPASGINLSSPSFEAASRACASLGPSGAPSQAGSATVASLRRWLTGRAAAHAFSGVVLVARGDRVALQAGYGDADTATATANTPRTSFCIASIGKLFTAVAIAQLVQAHRLAFTTRLGALLPDLSRSLRPVTIAQLLTMTAGLGDEVLSERDPPRALAGQVALIAKERPAFRPGTRFLYSNDDYILLGAIVARISGESYAGYLQAHIFGPAGMTHTELGVYTPARVRGMAHGYAVAGGRRRDISGRPQIANPSGGARSTAGDLLAFARALLHHVLLSGAMTRTVLTPRVDSPQPGGPAVDRYTYGFAYQALHGVVFVGHNGGTPGYEGQLDIYPHSGDVAIVLANQQNTMVPVIQRTEALLT